MVESLILLKVHHQEKIPRVVDKITVFALCNWISKRNLIQGGSYGAEGGSRTRTPVGHYPLKIARLPIPPLRPEIGL